MLGGRNAATARDGAPTQRSAGFDTLSPQRGARLLLLVRRAGNRTSSAPADGRLEPLAGRRQLTNRAKEGHRASREPGQDPSLSASPGQDEDIGNN